MTWYDFLNSAGRGLGRGISKVGRTLADPFYESEEERLARLLGGADFGPTASAGLGGDYSPNFKKDKSFWDILGDIGETTGRAATQVGRNLPYVGPLVQAGEYGILKGLGKEDSSWARGNAFAENEKSYEALDAKRAFEEKERQQKLGLMPGELEAQKLENTATQGLIDNRGLERQQLEEELLSLAEKRQALEGKYGTGVDAAKAEIEFQIEERQAKLDYLSAQTSTEYKQGNYYEEGRSQTKDPYMYSPADVERIAIEYANAVGGTGIDRDPVKWQEGYDYKYRELTQKMNVRRSEYKSEPTTSINPPAGWLEGLNLRKGPLTTTGQGVPSPASPTQPTQGLGVAGSPSSIDPASQSVLDQEISANGPDMAMDLVRKQLFDGKIEPDEAKRFIEYIRSITERQKSAETKRLTGTWLEGL